MFVSYNKHRKFISAQKAKQSKAKGNSLNFIFICFNISHYWQRREDNGKKKV